MKEEKIYRFALNPVFITAFLVMIINDHLLRKIGILPLITGKISDIAILIFLPAIGALVIVYLKYIIHLILKFTTGGKIKIDYQLTPFIIAASIIFSSTIFTLINTYEYFNTHYIVFINSINIIDFIFPKLHSTSDITDLITVPSVLVSYFILSGKFSRWRYL